MGDKAFHRNALIVMGVVIVGALLWWYANQQAIAASAPADAPTVTPAASVSFYVPGLVNNYGPVNFPATPNIIFPALGAPQALVNTPMSVGSMSGGDCSCGCDGSGGSTTYNLTPPDFSGVINGLLQSEAASANALITTAYDNMGYSMGVFASNATPSAFSGGLFPGY